MAEAVHYVEAIDTPVAMNSTSFATRMTLSAAELATAGFQNNDEVLVLFWAILSSANVGAEQVWQLTYNGTAITSGAASPRMDFRQTGTGKTVGFVGRVNLGTLADFLFQNQRQGTSANVTVQKARFAVIRLSDFGTENTDWFWNKSTTNVANTTTYSATNRASITYTPAAASEDWIVLMYCHQAIDATNVNSEVRARLDGSTDVCGDWSQEGSSTTEEWAMWTWGVLQSLAASSHTVAVETRDDTATAANDHRESALFIFRKSKWTDIFYNLVASQSMTSNTDTQLATVTSSMSATQNSLVIGRGRMVVGELSGGFSWVRQGGTTIIAPVTDDGAGQDDASWDANDTTDETNVLWMGYLSLSSGAQDLDYFGNQAGASTRTMQAPGLLVWGMNKAGAGGDQNLDGVLFSRAPTFPNGRLDLQVSGALFTRPPTFPAGTLTPVNTLAGVLFSRAPVFPAGQVQAEQTLAGVLFSRAPVFPAGVVAAEQTLAGVLHTVAPVFPTGRLDLNLGGVLFARSPVFPTGTVTGLNTLSGVLFSRAPTFPAGVLLQAQVLAGVLFARAPVFPAGVLTPGPVTITGVLFSVHPAFPAGAVVIVTDQDGPPNLIFIPDFRAFLTLADEGQSAVSVDEVWAHLQSAPSPGRITLADTGRSTITIDPS